MTPAIDLFSEYKKAHALLSAGDLRVAADLCQRILNADPHFAYGHHLMSMLFMKTGNLDKALFFADRAVKCGPDIVMFQVWMGELLFHKKDFPAAEQVLKKALAIEPDNVAGLGQLFASLTEQQKKAEAQKVMMRIIELEPPDPKLQHLHAMMRGVNIQTAPKEFVTTLFDGFADNFDHHLQDVLSYKVPSLLADIIRALPSMKDKASLSLLDLGCGTGLVAEALKDITSLRVGVDLSQKMLDRAQTKQLYAELHQGDIIEFMLTCDRTFDMVVATDVVNYLGDLEPLFKATRKVLSASSFFAFSVETGDHSDAFRLNAAGRYSHNVPPILSLAREAGYQVIIQDECILRTGNDQPVKGMLFVLKRANIKITAAADPVYTTEDMLRKDFWLTHFPKLTIEAPSAARQSLTRPTVSSLARVRERMLTEGYFDGQDEKLAALASLLSDAVRQCVHLQIPPTFVFLFDQTWECFYRLYPVLAHLLGDNYRFLPDFWSWYVNPQQNESGWKPHRDKGRIALAPDGSPLSLTVWVPLSEATTLNSCIYLLPADRDPVYNTPQEKQWQFPAPDIRALPAKPGEYLCWNQAILHWGSHSSPYATHPRISMALECQRGDIDAFNQPLLEPLAILPFTARLQLIAKQILQYQHMYALSPELQTLAQRILSN